MISLNGVEEHSLANLVVTLAYQRRFKRNPPEAQQFACRLIHSGAAKEFGARRCQGHPYPCYILVTLPEFVSEGRQHARNPPWQDKL